MWTQCAHKMPIIIVPIPPKTTPPFFMAFGIARIPVPRDDFKRWANAPKSLRKYTVFGLLFPPIERSRRPSLTNWNFSYPCDRTGCKVHPSRGNRRSTPMLLSFYKIIIHTIIDKGNAFRPQEKNSRAVKIFHLITAVFGIFLLFSHDKSANRWIDESK